MKKLSLLLLFSYCAATTAEGQSTNTPLPRPKLVVGLVVDQMRWDYLYRYYDRYADGGFKRMLRQGFSCENTYIDYLPTVTAIGHTTIYTGSVPAIHGIAGNDFILNQTGKSMYCTGDSTVQTVGSASTEGKMSPRNLLASTITDELKMATNFRSKVIGIALKDRGSILPAGHTPDAAYWFDNASGNWITSSYYMNELPGWLQRFNSQRLPETYLKKDWNTLFPIETYVQSSKDSNRYEGKFANHTAPTFPVKTSLSPLQNFDLIRTTPYGNTMTLDLARAAIENENLGKDAITDFLAISCSSTDYIGHKFGVNSVEIEDTYLRLDRDLSSFFNYLDQRVGKGSYTVFLSADHGAAHNAEFLMDNQIPSGYFQSNQALTNLKAKLDSLYKVKNLVISLSNFQVHLNYPEISKNALDEEAIRATCVRFLSELPAVEFVVDAKNMSKAAIPFELQNRVLNGYHKERSGSIVFFLKPGWYPATLNATGTTHGGWHPYDAHIPLVWMGWGINQGKTVKRTNMTDISATLASLLRIQTPNGCIGNAIGELIKNSP
ncbi:MAG TPA: alkaline phosphatase PafA [Chitinophagaceae bacterium]|nr:alkaline phosphatase PafA [Chitinophagaceae bacterium]